MASADDLSGVRVAEKYDLVRLLGRGGMGAVYEARQVSTLKRCAVKILLTPALSGDAEVVKRFFREARASGLIESEHVVAAFDSGTDAAGRVYYVMECLQGEDLQQTLRRLGSLSPIVATKILLQAARGLASAHALGIVHRDVKPANLFLAQGADDEVKVKILDFGVAKVKMEVFNESSLSLTQTGSMLGTPLYMSPEQVKRASAIDASADVWSLGVVLFECLAGQLPWGKVESIGELIAAILTLEMPLVQDLAPWVQPELAGLLHRALLRDPTHRLRSAAELRDALKKLLPDARLSRHEVQSPAPEERVSIAPRLSLSDTVIVGPPPRSGTPMVLSRVPRAAARGTQLALVLGAAALAAGGAWTAARQSSRAGPTSAALDTATTVPSAVVARAEVASLVRPSPEQERRSLEVGPVGVQVSVDGVSVPVNQGRATVEGVVGTARRVRVTHSGRTTERLVAITNDGLVPATLVVAAPSPISGPGAERSKRTSRLDSRVTDSPVAPAVAPDTASAAGLSEKFE